MEVVSKGLPPQVLDPLFMPSVHDSGVGASNFRIDTPNSGFLALTVIGFTLDGPRQKQVAIIFGSLGFAVTGPAAHCSVGGSTISDIEGSRLVESK